MQIMQIEDKRKAKAKLQAMCNSYAEAMSAFKRGIEKAGMGFVPACFCVLNSLKFRLLPKNCQTGKL
jgi:hypothetical protein